MASREDVGAVEALAAQAMLADAQWARPRLAAARARLARGQPCDRLLAELVPRLQASVAAAKARAQWQPRLVYPEELPISRERERLLGVLRDHRAVVLTGETGSGKTTQLPKLLLEAGYGRRGLIAITQPRRVAALSIAARLREELAVDEPVVVHGVRFDDRTTAETVIRVVTDGLLLAECRRDPDLARYDAIIIDEAHERSLTIDLLLGLTRRLRERRPELLLAVASASIASERFASYLGSDTAPAPHLHVTGRTFPVEIRWQEAPDQEGVGYLGQAIQAITALHQEEPGDCLCFLPTERDILEAARRLGRLPGATVLPLFARLTPGEQTRIFRPVAGRKIVLATNIAETSLTIPGIRYVVDAGLARIKRYHASSRTERLPVEAVAQASCIQRAGRAGRVAPGVCVRLYGKDDFARREPYATPEIQRSNLAGVLLSCLALGIADPTTFPWLDPPAPHAWRQARLLLEELGALVAGTGERLRLSGIGEALAAIPADPQVGRILLAGIQDGVAHEACTLAAFLSVQDPRVRPVGQEAAADRAQATLARPEGDLATVLALWDRWQEQPSNTARSRLCDALFLGYRRMREWADVRHQLWSQLRETRAGRSLPTHGHAAGGWPLDRVHRAVLAGMLGNVLLYDAQEQAYRGAQGRLLQVHPGSSLRQGAEARGRPGAAAARRRAPPAWLVACEVVETSRLYARLVAPIDPVWIEALAGDRLTRSWRDPHWSPERQQVVVRETLSWKGLPVRRDRLVPFERVDPAAATVLLCRAMADPDSGMPAQGDLAVLAENQRALAALADLRHRLRDPGLGVGRDDLEAFYRQQLGCPATADEAERTRAPIQLRPAPADSPPPVASSDALRRWCHAQGADRLRRGLADLVDPAVIARAASEAPSTVVIAGMPLPLSYRFDPGGELDGATLTLTEAQLARLDPATLERLVPGWVPVQVEALVQALPKPIRQRLHPLAEAVQRITALALGPARSQPVAEVVQATAAEAAGQRVALPPGVAVPRWTRLRLVVTAPDGTVLSVSRDPALIAGQVQAAPDRLAPLRRRYATEPEAHWPGDVAEEPVREGGVSGWIGLARGRDAQGRVAASRTVYASRRAWAAWHDDGLRALLEAALAPELTALVDAPCAPGRQAVIERALGARLGALRRACAVAALARTDRGGVVHAGAWEALRSQAAGLVAALARTVDVQLEQAAVALTRTRQALADGGRSSVALVTVPVVQAATTRLLGPPFAGSLGPGLLADVPELLAGGQELLARGRRDPADARRRAERAQALAGDVDDTLGADPQRWAQALGWSRRLTELLQGRERCLAQLLGGTGAASGWAEGQLRQAAHALGQELAQARTRLLGARAELIALRPALARLPPAQAAAQGAALDAAIARLPDLSLLADLDQQVVEAQALAARLRGSGG